MLNCVHVYLVNNITYRYFKILRSYKFCDLIPTGWIETNARFFDEENLNPLYLIFILQLNFNAYISLEGNTRTTSPSMREHYLTELPFWVGSMNIRKAVYLREFSRVKRKITICRSKTLNYKPIWIHKFT